MLFKKFVSFITVAVILTTIISVQPYRANIVPPVVFTDSLNDLSKVVDYGTCSSSYYDFGSSGTILNGDGVVMLNAGYFDGLKGSNGIMANHPYLTWKINGGAKAEIMAYFWNWDSTKDFKISWSADGQNFIDVGPDSIVYDEITSANKVEKNVDSEYKDYTSAMCRLATINKIDDTAKYIRITWPTIDAGYKADPSMVRITGGTSENTSYTFNTTTIISNNKIIDTADMIDYTADGFYYNQLVSNAPVLMVDNAYVSGKTIVAKPYVVYKVSNSSPFRATFIGDSRFYKMNSKVKLYVSDNINSGWTETGAAQGRTQLDSSLSNQTYFIPAVPSGKNYVKVEFPNDKDYSGISWGDGTAGTASDALNYMINLTKVEYNKFVVQGDNGTPIATDTAIDISGDASIDTKAFYDYNNQVFDFDQKLGTTPFLSLSYGYVAGKTTLPEIFVTYKVKPGCPFILKSVNHIRFINLNKKFKLKSSADGTTWQEIINVAYTVKPYAGEAGWYEEEFTVAAIPSTDKYVKVIWPNEKDYNGTYDPVAGDTISNPVNYAPGLLCVKFNKSDDQGSDIIDPPIITGDTTINFSGNAANDIKAFYAYNSKAFDFDQKLGTTPFLSLSYGYVAGKTTLPEIFVTYKVEAGSPFILKGVNHVRFIDLNKKFKLKSSADAVTWQEIENAAYTVKPYVGEAGWYDEEFVVAAIPSTDKYVKVVWPNEKDYTGILDPVIGDTINNPVNYAPGILSVTFNKSSEQVSEITDPTIITGDTTITFVGDETSDSNGMVSYNKDAIDFSQSMQIGERNIPVLMLKYDFVAGKSSLPEAYVEYSIAEGSPFKVTGYTHPNAIDMDLKFKIFGSVNGKDWVQINNVLYVITPMSGTNWLKETYGIPAMPSGTRFVKIVWPNKKDYTGVINSVTGTTLDSLSYASTIESITFNTGSANTGDNWNMNNIIFAVLSFLVGAAFVFSSKKKKALKK